MFFLSTEKKRHCYSMMPSGMASTDHSYAPEREFLRDKRAKPKLSMNVRIFCPLSF